jgi:hypothetical protein
VKTNCSDNNRDFTYADEDLSIRKCLNFGGFTINPTAATPYEAKSRHLLLQSGLLYRRYERKSGLAGMTKLFLRRRFGIHLAGAGKLIKKKYKSGAKWCRIAADWKSTAFLID